MVSSLFLDIKRERESNNKLLLISFSVILISVFAYFASPAFAMSSYTNGASGWAIYVYGANADENMTSINQSIANAFYLEDLGNKEWLLKVPVIVNGTTATLRITDVDTSWLKLQSLNDSNVSYIKIQGIGIINNTKITSWNTTNGVVAPSGDTNRSYVLITGVNSRTNVTNSIISDLGISSFLKYGFTYDSTSNNIIHNNTFANSTYGMFSYHSTNLNISDNIITGNALEGLTLSYSYGGDAVLRNRIYNNSGRGLTIQNSSLVSSN
ncbi:MAG: right-handed parallel beta-helix repeat-containing protein, partial [Nanoarchaeota archaeon]|nr:right-handed parallel beta-helix repeat-containing protein [Nanoarchaeota archaeon]